MKKILTILLTVVLFVLLFFISGCKKDEENTLNGTRWVYNENNEIITLTFQQSSFTMAENDNNYSLTQGGGSYSYDPPNISIQGTASNEIVTNWPITASGTVSGNQMTLSFVGGGSFLSFIKQ